MDIAKIEGATRVCGEEQGYMPLPIRDECVNVASTDGSIMAYDVNRMVTAWKPTLAELVALNRGACVEVKILGRSPPPLLVEVGPVPDQAATDDAPLVLDTHAGVI